MSIKQICITNKTPAYLLLTMHNANPDINNKIMVPITDDICVIQRQERMDRNMAETQISYVHGPRNGAPMDNGSHRTTTFYVREAFEDVIKAIAAGG